LSEGGEMTRERERERECVKYVHKQKIGGGSGENEEEGTIPVRGAAAVKAAAPRCPQVGPKAVGCK